MSSRRTATSSSPLTIAMVIPIDSALSFSGSFLWSGKCWASCHPPGTRRLEQAFWGRLRRSAPLSSRATRSCRGVRGCVEAGHALRPRQPRIRLPRAPARTRHRRPPRWSDPMTVRSSWIAGLAGWEGEQRAEGQRRVHARHRAATSTVVLSRRASMTPHPRTVRGRVSTPATQWRRRARPRAASAIPARRTPCAARRRRVGTR